MPFTLAPLTNLHHAQLLTAAKAGKHVLCEKPIAMSLQEGNEMVAACHEAGVVIATNHHLRNAAPMRKLQELVSGGAIGRPIAARVFHAVYLPENLQGWRINNPSARSAITLTNAEGEQQISVEHHSLDAETVRLFVDAVKGGGEPAASGEDGVISMAAALACLEAGESGMTVRI